MAPLITREEALELGELSAPADIEALVERAWGARTERFADSSDACCSSTPGRAVREDRGF